jgi:aminoglycoside phosphotransferase (APT) family kinase protein
MQPSLRSGLSPGLMPLLDVLRERANARATDLRAEAPCLVHTDASFHNLILGDDRVTLIDWDYPAARYPLEELEALEEHAYLNGISELPNAFFAGYGRQVSRPLLRLRRISAVWASSARPSGPIWLLMPALRQTSAP